MTALQRSILQKVYDEWGEVDSSECILLAVAGRLETYFQLYGTNVYDDLRVFIAMHAAVGLTSTDISPWRYNALYAFRTVSCGAGPGACLLLIGGLYFSLRFWGGARTHLKTP